jgi:hypothetical protein
MQPELAHSGADRFSSYLEGKTSRQRSMNMKVICFSGSTKFIEVMAVKMWEMERDNNVVTLGCHLLPQSYGAAPDHQAEEEGVAEHMDEVHLSKIDMCDELFVINVGGYIGDATRREIEYAISQGKPVKYLEPQKPEDCSECGDAPRCNIISGEIIWSSECANCGNPL